MEKLTVSGEGQILVDGVPIGNTPITLEFDIDFAGMMESGMLHSSNGIVELSQRADLRLRLREEALAVGLSAGMVRKFEESM